MMPALLNRMSMWPNALSVESMMPRDGLALRQVGLDRRATPAALLDPGLGLGLIHHVHRRDVGAGFGETERQSLTQAASRAGDDGDFAVQFELIQNSHVPTSLLDLSSVCPIQRLLQRRAEPARPTGDLVGRGGPTAPTTIATSTR